MIWLVNCAICASASFMLALPKSNALQAVLDGLIQAGKKARRMHQCKLRHQAHMPFLASFHGVNVLKTLSQAKALLQEQLASCRNVQPLAGVCCLLFAHALLLSASRAPLAGALEALARFIRPAA